MANANTPDKLSPIHQHMAALCAAGLGTGEIAEITGYSQTAVSSIKGHPAFMELVSQFSTDLARRVCDTVAERIQGAASEALDVNLSLMRRASSERVRQISAFDILDRAGFKPREVHVSASVQLPQQDAAIIHETLKQMGASIPDRPPVDNAVSLLTRAAGDREKEGGGGGGGGETGEASHASGDTQRVLPSPPSLPTYNIANPASVAGVDELTEQINSRIKNIADRVNRGSTVELQGGKA